MPGMYGCLGRVYIGLSRFTQNGYISAFQCRAEVLKSAFLGVWEFCAASCGLWSLWERRFAGIAEGSLNGRSEGRSSVVSNAGKKR